MVDNLEKENVKKDLESWMNDLQIMNKLISDLHSRMVIIYKEVAKE